jgi:DNA modification methylase
MVTSHHEKDAALYHGDCLEVLPTFPPASVEAIITDLPYGTTACKWDSIIPLDEMWKQVKRVLKPSGVFVTTSAQPFTSILITSNLSWFKYEWIWEKPRVTGYLSANHRPMRSHENIVVFGNGISYNPQMVKGDLHKVGAKKRHRIASPTRVYASETGPELSQSDQWFPRSIIKFSSDPETTVTKKDRPNKIERHPTQKPVKLYEYLIRTYTNPGDTVLDFCMGSGTTGVAAIQTGRNFIGIEKEQKYFEIASRRIAQAPQPLFTEPPRQPTQRAADAPKRAPICTCSLDDGIHEWNCALNTAHR